MNVLVCGGAGYIGSHMVKMLARHGHQVVTFDNLSTGHKASVKWGEFIRGDLLNATDLFNLFKRRDFDVVMHFAARSLVGESVRNPALYYRNNFTGTFNLLEQMRRAGTSRIIFSSTAAIFGNPIQPRIEEDHPKHPINPYGRTKLMVERLLQDYANAHGINSVSLRYFNAAGADAEGELGEEHEPETHLIPNILRAARGDKGTGLKLFGDDYDTEDGTCVRDYIHIEDLCSAHLKAVAYLMQREGAHAFNLGNGAGFSVKEVIDAAQAVVCRDISFEVAARREGDPATLVADSSKARAELDWVPAYTDMREIVRTAWNWMGNERTLNGSRKPTPA